VRQTSDAEWIERALQRARDAEAQGEVPVGAVLVRDDQVLAEGWNLIEAQRDPTGHAEIEVIRRGAEQSGSPRMPDTTLYVTLEPCAMCAGASVLARIRRVVFGAFDPKGGACGTLRNIVQDPRLNHVCDVEGGVLREPCAKLLSNFFSRLRSGHDRVES
jgi:tRNA(adenine34) deaminase